MYDEMTLRFSDEAFKPVLTDADKTLQRLIYNMVEKNSAAGTLTIKIDIELAKEWIDNFDPAVQGDKRLVRIPKLSHKVSSMMQIKDETKGDQTYEGYELAYNEGRGEYVLKPVISAQQDIFNSDYNYNAASAVSDENDEKSEERENIPDEKETALIFPRVITASADIKESESPFEYLRRFINQDIGVFEALGNYTVRANNHTVLLSSAFSPTNQFYCHAEKLKPHVGCAAECVIRERGERRELSIVCRDCGEVLFSTDSQSQSDNEPDKNNANAEIAGSNQPGDKSDKSNDKPDNKPNDEPDNNLDDELDDISDIFDGYPYENPANLIKS